MARAHRIALHVQLDYGHELCTLTNQSIMHEVMRLHQQLNAVLTYDDKKRCGGQCGRVR